jgi:phosphatidylglycerophosphate synthase
VTQPVAPMVTVPPVVNVPNAITLVRTVVAIGLAVPAVTHASVRLAVAAYLCYWIGDILDGLSARLLKRETRIGAVFDIISDRACCALCAAALLVIKPGMALPVTLFLIQFMVLDCVLSLAFLYWPLVSPNYFGSVHPGVYRWNWSPPAKAINTSGVVFLVLFAPSPWYPVAFVLAVTVIKVVSMGAVARMLVERPAP